MSSLPQEFMTGALLHFESGVPIDDLNLRPEQKRRMSRVQHVYWQWIRNPFAVDYKALLRQLVKGHYADAPSETRAAQKDIALFEFVKENVTVMSRKEAQLKVTLAAEKAIRIGMDTDDVMALTKGGKLLYEVAGLNQPESERADMNRVAFMPTVVVTDIREVDDTKENIDDEETKRIIAKYGAFVDEKHKAVEDKVALMEADAGIGAAEEAEYTEETE